MRASPLLESRGGHWGGRSFDSRQRIPPPPFVGIHLDPVSCCCRPRCFSLGSAKIRTHISPSCSPPFCYPLSSSCPPPHISTPIRPTMVLTTTPLLNRVEHVGSFLRPPHLLTAREKHAQGTLSASELRQVEDAAIREVVEKQEKAGLRGVSDGEFRREYFHLDCEYAHERERATASERRWPR